MFDGDKGWFGARLGASRGGGENVAAGDDVTEVDGNAVIVGTEGNVVGDGGWCRGASAVGLDWWIWAGAAGVAGGGGVS